MDRVSDHPVFPEEVVDWSKRRVPNLPYSLVRDTNYPKHVQAWNGAMGKHQTVVIDKIREPTTECVEDIVSEDSPFSVNYQDLQQYNVEHHLLPPEYRQQYEKWKELYGWECAWDRMLHAMRQADLQ
jgi:hypothetical protein